MNTLTKIKTITLCTLVAALATACGVKESEVDRFDPRFYEGFNRDIEEAKTLEALDPFEFPEISYEGLVERVRTNGGELTIPMETNWVGKQYLTSQDEDEGYGYGWTAGMEGLKDGIGVILNTDDLNVKKEYDRGSGFSEKGEGYAHASVMDGMIGSNVGGIRFTLSEIKTKRFKTKDDSFFQDAGYGFEFVEEMRGDVGEQLRAVLITEETYTRTETHDSNYGYGFAAIKSAKLILSLKEPEQNQINGTTPTGLRNPIIPDEPSSIFEGNNPKYDGTLRPYDNMQARNTSMKAMALNKV